MHPLARAMLLVVAARDGPISALMIALYGRVPASPVHRERWTIGRVVLAPRRAIVRVPHVLLATAPVVRAVGSAAIRDRIPASIVSPGAARTVVPRVDPKDRHDR